LVAASGSKSSMLHTILLMTESDTGPSGSLIEQEDAISDAISKMNDANTILFMCINNTTRKVRKIYITTKLFYN